jgi:hypothetical protein
MAASLVIGGVLLVAMVAASGRAAVVLPADALIAIHCGSVEHCYLASKRAGLVIWPVLGAIWFGVLGGIAGSGLAAGWVPGVRDVLVPAVMCVALGFQVGALILARRWSERVTMPAPAGSPR